jgi:hypothetical protein
MERQKHGDSLLDDDDDENEEDFEGENEDLVALQSTLDVSRGSSDGAGSSCADCPAGVAIEESSIRKWAASSPLRGPSPKCPYAATVSSHDSSHVAPVAPFLIGPEAPI